MQRLHAPPGVRPAAGGTLRGMRLRIGLISADAGRDWQVQRLLRALQEVADAVLLHPASLRVTCGGDEAVLSVRSGSLELTGLDAALVGRVVSEEGDPDLALDAVRALELAGVPLVNRVGPMLAAQDKLHTACVLTRAGLPTPLCSSVPTADLVDAACEAMPRAVAKPVFGSLGDGLFQVTDRRGRARLRRSATGDAHLVQRFVPPGGVDFRLFVVGDRVQGCLRREAAPGEWRSNVGRGARALPAVARPAWRTVAIEATRALGLEVAGVDLALDGRRPTVLEVNGFPRFAGLLQATGRDMAPAIARRVVELARARPARIRRQG